MKAFIIFTLFFVPLLVLGQKQDSTAIATRKALNDKFPTTRTFDLQYEQLGSTDNTSEFLENASDKRTIQNHFRLKLASNIVFYRSPSKKLFLTNSLRYKYESFAFTDIQDPTASGSDMNFHYFAEAVSLTYFSSLFKKPVIYNATATLDANQYNFQRVKGMASGIIVLKKTPNTTITVGLLLMIDPSSIVPIAPIATYEHQFVNSKWKLDFILPKQILVRRPLLENGRLSLGTELSSENFYLSLNNTNFRGVYELNQLELHSGIIYEYCLGKAFNATFKTGVAHILNSRITERGEKTSNYVIENKQEAQFYFNIGLSYNPF